LATGAVPPATVTQCPEVNSTRGFHTTALQLLPHELPSKIATAATPGFPGTNVPP
jgi:hypothetical protein